MNILVACETSGQVRNAFNKYNRRWENRQGIHAYSCDILESDDNSTKHYIADCKEIIKSRFWDIIIMPPPCTALSVSGNATYAKGMKKYHERLKSIKWTTHLWRLAKRHSRAVCMENPVGVLPFKPSQYIQPWMFGHPESKKTGLWLHNLPKLKETNNVKHIMDKLPKNKQQRLHYLPPSPERSKIRSKTFAGIASAMASQWKNI